MVADTTCDVAIVGYGPTGATLANLLALSGLQVAVIEREAAMHHLPRAVHFDGETMRVFQTVGIADALSELVHVNPGMRFLDPDGHLLLDWPRPPGVGPQGWHASYRLHQPDLERLLRARLEACEAVTVWNGNEVTSIETNDEGVVLGCRQRDDGASHVMRARYVVGCDGARSFVRQAMGSALKDLGFEERWLVVDVLLRRDRPDLGDHSIQYCDPVRPMTYCRSPGVRRRWEITVLADETNAEVLDEARIWAFLAPWIGPEDAVLERSAVYTFRSAVADVWRKGHVLIAGDAAHLTPPFMGQGMCAGIRDAANLAWKLALCVQGRAGTDILDSYQAERDPNVRQFIETAMRLGGLINTVDREAALAKAEPTGSGAARMSSISPPLGQSTLFGAGSGTAHARHLIAQPILANGHSLDDEVGYKPVLLVRRPSSDIQDAKVPVYDGAAHSMIAEVLDTLGVTAALIRPDRYIAATAASEDDIKSIAALSVPFCD